MFETTPSPNPNPEPGNGENKKLNWWSTISYWREKLPGLFTSKKSATKQPMTESGVNLVAIPKQLEDQPKELVEVVEPAVEYFQSLGKEPLASLEKMLGIPENMRSNGNVIASLAANNRFDKETEQEFVNLKLDGHIIGVGAASIFCMIEGFTKCESFTGIDIHPSPIAIGRVVVELLNENDTFESFFLALSNEEQFKTKVSHIGLPDGYLAETVESVKYAVTQYKQVQNRYPGVKAEGFHVSEMDLKNLFPLKSIENHYQTFKKLAQSGKMNFVQADFFNPRLWQELTTIDPSVKEKNNLIFGSNAIDHVFRAKMVEWGRLEDSGLIAQAKAEQEAFGQATYLNFSEWNVSTFVFTLTSLKYQLQVKRNAPQYRYDNNEDGPALKN